MKAFWNNTLVETSEIRINPTDLGMLRGFTVFDVLIVEQGRAFLWERHYARLVASASAMGLTMPLSEVDYGRALSDLIAASETNELVIRTVLSGGPSVNGFTPELGQETFYILAEERHRLPAHISTQGVKLITLPYERCMPQVKLANHAVSIADLARRRGAGAFDTLYVSHGLISEASQGNVLLVKDGVLVTPREEVLWGVVQGLTMELAEALGMPTQWRQVSLEELLGADEVLLTGSSKGIVPVTRIDDTMIGMGKPGAFYAQLAAAYQERVDAA